MSEPTSLYRHFDADGILLYVGISLSWPKRTKDHVRGSRWFDAVVKVEIERFASRDEALAAERRAIQAERPVFNIVHNCEPKPAKPKPKPFVSHDPILRLITGPVAIVGPALMYRDDTLSLIVAHGQEGRAGGLVEIVLGRLAAEVPEWAYMADMVAVIRSGDEVTLDEARDMRSKLVAKLQRHLDRVETCETDISLAVANASTFPSKKSRAILDDVAQERSAA